MGSTPRSVLEPHDAHRGLLERRAPTEVELPSILVQLHSYFSEGELAKLLPSLTLVDMSKHAVRSRLSQASFLLNGCKDATERNLVRRSLVLQGAYYLQQPFAIVHEDEHVLVVDKPFDMQIAHRTRQQARFPHEITLSELAAERLTDYAEAPAKTTLDKTATTAAAEAAATVLTDNLRLWPCHQLDYATSGVIIFAKTKEALSVVTQAFDGSGDDASGRGSAPRWHEGRISAHKEYTAVVYGWPSWETYDFEGPMDVDPTSEFKMRIVSETVSGSSRTPSNLLASSSSSSSSSSPPPSNVIDASNVVDTSVAARWGPSRLPSAASWSEEGRTPRPRHSSTRIEVLRRSHYALDGPLAGRRVTLVRLVPKTGRRHQLRVTLAHLGHPIVGDVAYAGDLSSFRLMLHASALTFRRDDDEDGEDGSHEQLAGDLTPPDAATRSPSDQPLEPRGDGLSGRRARARARRRKQEVASGLASRQERVLGPLDGHRLGSLVRHPFGPVLAPAEQK